MQWAVRSLLSNGNAVITAVLERFRVANPMMLRPVVFSRFQSTSSARMEEHGFESTLIADVLKAKGKGADGSWLRCTTDDSVYNAVKSISFYWTVTDEASDKHSHASGNCSTTDLTKQPTSMLSIWRPGLQRGTVESETEYNTEHHNNAPLMNRL
ncbi:hypothetical protein LWI28_027215 [Acer negundo]|uniref:Uncharacterized protein n=1 Tax=Acer negundo TaxID=4023 RepID=A0AAD5J7N9_ACENE|nr:hypothetical protein LWI28_027215 [Acer negundo]